MFERIQGQIGMYQHLAIIIFEVRLLYFTGNKKAERLFNLP